MKYIIGNWKSNKTEKDVEDWFLVIKKYFDNSTLNLFNLEIIICPPNIYLKRVKELRDDNRLPIKIGAQNISPFGEGAYTGEINGRMLSEYAQYVIIGHSERRKNFKEDDSLLEEKANQAQTFNLKPIFCLPDEKTFIPQNVKIIAYEPVFAIGTGKADTPENANKVGEFIKNRKRDSVFIYGGSVTENNIVSFLNAGSIDGVLPGKASLDPHNFWEMIKNASKF